MEHLVVSICALVVSGLTLFSGFGLGTLLLPVFALFFPVETAVAATALVHGANNVLKASLLGRRADRQVVLRFGVPAVLAAFVGAAALGAFAGLPPIAEYTLGPRQAVLTPVKLVMGVLMAAFALFELLPGLRHLEFDRRWLTLGGVLSGFFGGLSGHQGALRSAFLAKAGIGTAAFVGTNAVIGLAVDVARLLVYGGLFRAGLGDARVVPLVATGTLAAFAGVVVGSRMLEKVTMATIQKLTGTLLLGIALALGTGLL